jgi:hypothetical protein
MEAAEARVQEVLEASKQFMVPHYQRPYSWIEKHWEVLSKDLVELIQGPDAKPHSIGSIVTAPARSIPEGVEKRLLSDGQQRRTTSLTLLALIRERAMAGIRLKCPVSVSDRETWPATLEWLTRHAVALRAAFAPQIARLDL